MCIYETTDIIYRLHKDKLVLYVTSIVERWRNEIISDTDFNLNSLRFNIKAA